MNNPFDFFDAIFCINLGFRADRWSQCLKKFKNFNIEKKVERFSAIRILDKNYNCSKFLAQCGCSLSHFEVCKLAKKRGYKNYLVLEDDFEFIFNKKKTFNLLNKCIYDLPNDWDMFYIGGNLTDQYGIFPIELFSENLFKLKSCHTTHAISFNEKFYDEFLKESPDENSIFNWCIKNETIDTFLSENILNKKNCFITNELLVNQFAGFSDIENYNYDYKDLINANFNKFKMNCK